jgi:hypothetical protein
MADPDGHVLCVLTRDRATGSRVAGAVRVSYDAAVARDSSWRP